MVNNIIYSQSIISDSIKKEFPEINIIKEKDTESKILNSQNFKNIDLSKSNYQLSHQISNVLSNVSGIYIKDLGGNSALKSISFRGLSASQTLIKIDDIPINSSSNGMVDLSTITLNLFDNIEITKNASFGLFSNSSLIGDINLRTKSNNNNNTQINLLIGSFNEYSLNFKINNKELGIYSSIFYSYSENNYQYNAIEFNKSIRKPLENANFSNFSGLLKYSFNKQNLLIIYKNIFRGIPEPNIPNLNFQTNSNLTENDLFIVYNSLINDQLKLQLSLNLNNLKYENNNEISKILNISYARYFSKSLNLNLKYEKKVFNTDNEFAINYSYLDLNGDMLDKNTDHYVYRNSITINHLFYLNILNNSLLSSDLSISNNFSDYFSNSKNDYSYNFGSALLIKIKNIDFISKIIFSSNTRLPNFNEMYYLNYGNTNLEKEQAFNYELFFEKSLNNFIKFSISLFNIDIKNQIISIPNSPISWSAQNLGKMRNQGIEISISSLLFGEFLKGEIEYTYQNPINNDRTSSNYLKLIPYIPQEMLSFVGSMKISEFLMKVYVNYNSHRYYLPDNSIESIMNSYGLLGIYLNYHIYKYNCFLKFDNLTSKQYEIIKNYPMPEISFKLGVNYEIY